MLTDGIANPFWPNYRPWMFSRKRRTGFKAYTFLTFGNLTPILTVTLHNGADYPDAAV
jgi:hypothetical protein